MSDDKHIDDKLDELREDRLDGFQRDRWGRLGVPRQVSPKRSAGWRDGDRIPSTLGELRVQRWGSTLAVFEPGGAIVATVSKMRPTKLVPWRNLTPEIERALQEINA